MKYLAIPYTDTNPEVMRQRFETANRTAAELMKRGLLIYSPISHSHPIAQHGLPLDWEYWQHYDKEILSICDELIIIMADGWEESNGINAERDMAFQRGMVISYINPILTISEGRTKNDL
jgi:hypothetical protein